MRHITAAIVVIIAIIGTAHGQQLTIADGQTVTLDGANIDAQGASAAIKITSGKLILRHCRLANAKHYLIDANGPVTVELDSCELSHSMHGVRLRGPARGIIRDCTITDWHHYGILIEGTEEAGPIATITGNTFHRPSAGKGGARSMIFASNTKRLANIFDLIITGNRCLGPGEPYDRNSDSSRGTSDQISLNYCQRFILSGNVSTGGGENGITITNQCSDGVVSANVVTVSDGHGIQISSRGERARNVMVYGNAVTNNGTRLDGQRDTLAGIYVHDGERVAVFGNLIAGEHKYGVLVAESDRIDVGPNAITSERTDFEAVKRFENGKVK